MSATAVLFPPPAEAYQANFENPLPGLLHTPAGLALLEIQGTINLPHRQEEHQTGDQSPPGQISIGRLVFPGYSPDATLNTWTKTVHMYVGLHQRLTGEVKKLPKAIAVFGKKNISDDGSNELEIVEIVKWKILFSQRPEPVGTWNGED